MSDYELTISGNIVDPDGVDFDAWIAIREGKIAARGHGTPPQARDAAGGKGLWLLPGVVDGQVHSGSQRDQEGLGWTSRAAAAGGVTVMVDMPYDDPEPVASAQQLILKAAEVERDCHVDAALYATLNHTHGFAAAAELIEAGACAFKFSTFEAAPGRFPRVEEDDLHRAFGLIAPAGLACGVHNQMQELTRKNVARLQAAADTGWDAFARANTPLVEDLATALIYEIGAQTGARAHAVHVSTARGFEICNMYRANGHSASIETCVQYLMLNHEQHARRLGAQAKHYPPLRPKAETERLWSHIAAGHCTFVSSDHVSWSLDRKMNPNIFLNASGGPGIDTLLPAFWTGCEQHGLPPSTVARQLCANPARHFLLDDRKGSLEVGKDADVVLLDSVQYSYDPARSLSAVTWSAYEGMTFNVRVLATYCRGGLAFDGQRVVNQPGHGRFLRPRHHPDQTKRDQHANKF